MRVIALVLCAILISSAVAESKITLDTICPENFKEAIEQLRNTMNDPKVNLAEKRVAIQKFMALRAKCAREFIINNIDRLGQGLTLAATPADCEMWNKRVELLKKLIQDPYTRTDRVLGEYAETLYRIQREC